MVERENFEREKIEVCKKYKVVKKEEEERKNEE